MPFKDKDKFVEWSREYYLKNKDIINSKKKPYAKERREYWLSKLQCPHCTEHRHLTEGINICKECAAKKSACSTRYKDRLRYDILQHYSNGLPHCDCCGETEIKFLAIDHINGNGRQHRAKVGAGKGLYRWLKKNNYPGGYRILCHNCNLAVGFYGSCPHQSEVTS